MRRMKKIILVDDDPIFLTFISDALSKEYDIVKYSNPLDALSFLTENEIDLALLDIQMPDLDGYELCSQIRAITNHTSLPIIILSAKKGSFSRSLAYKLGVLNYLEKPFEINELRELVKSILNFTNPKTINYMLEIGELKFDPIEMICYHLNNKFRLTRNEGLILETLIKRQGSTVNRDCIALKLARNGKVSYRTIDTHISSLRKKIKNINVKIFTIYGEGYTLQEIYDI